MLQNSKSVLKINIQSQQFKRENKKMFFSLVQKTNHSGFGSNTRLLVLHPPDLSYLSKLSQLPFTNYSEPPHKKASVNLKDLEVTNNTGKKFQVLFKDPKNKMEKWIFETSSETMAKQWVELIRAQKEKELNKNLTISKVIEIINVRNKEQFEEESKQKREQKKIHFVPIQIKQEQNQENIFKNITMDDQKNLVLYNINSKNQVQIQKSQQKNQVYQQNLEDMLEEQQNVAKQVLKQNLQKLQMEKMQREFLLKKFEQEQEDFLKKKQKDKNEEKKSIFFSQNKEKTKTLKLEQEQKQKQKTYKFYQKKPSNLIIQKKQFTSISNLKKDQNIKDTIENLQQVQSPYFLINQQKKELDKKKEFQINFIKCQNPNEKIQKIIKDYKQNLKQNSNQQFENMLEKEWTLQSHQIKNQNRQVILQKQSFNLDKNQISLIKPSQKSFKKHDLSKQIKPSQKSFQKLDYSKQNKNSFIFKQNLEISEEPNQQLSKIIINSSQNNLEKQNPNKQQVLKYSKFSKYSKDLSKKNKSDAFSKKNITDNNIQNINSQQLIKKSLTTSQKKSKISQKSLLKQMKKDSQQSKKKEALKSQKKFRQMSFKEQQNQQSSYLIPQDYKQQNQKSNFEYQKNQIRERRISRSNFLDNQRNVHILSQKIISEKQILNFDKKKQIEPPQNSSIYLKQSQSKKKSNKNNIHQQNESILKKNKSNQKIQKQITSLSKNLFKQFMNISNKELQIDQKIVKMELQKKRFDQKYRQGILNKELEQKSRRQIGRKSRLKDQKDLQYQFNYKWFKCIEQYMKNPHDIIVNHQLFDVVYNFQITSKYLIKKIIDQLSLPEGLQSYRPITGTAIYQYQIDNINIILAFSSLQKKNQGNQIVNIYQQNALKLLNNEFRNYNYLATKAWDHNFRMPLAVLYQYKGFIALAIARVIFSVQNKPIINIHQLVKEVNVLSNIFQQSKFINLKWINKIYYQKIKQKQNMVINKNNDYPINFDLIVPSKILSLLPHIINDPTPEKLFRPQFIQNYPVLLSGNLLDNYDLTKKEIRDLQIASQKLKDCKIPQLISQLQTFSIPIMTSRELSEQFHKKGVNIRYMGEILKEVNMPYLKQLLKVDLISRVCKKILRQNIQQIILSNNKNFKAKKYLDDRQMELKKYNESLIYMVIDFFNLILGEGDETKVFEKIVQKQAWNDQKIQLDFNLHKPLLLLHLAEQCNIKINQLQIQSLSNKKQIYINRESIIGFEFHNKSFDLSNIYLIKSIRQNFNKRGTEKQRLDKLCSLISPHKSQPSIPQYLSFIQGQVISFISTVVQPTHYLPYSQPINRHNYSIWLHQLKWEFYKGQIKFALTRFQNFFKKLQFWYGQYNPFLQNIMKIAYDFYASRQELQQALNLSKKQLVNTLKVFGMTNFNSAKAYNNCARIMMKQNKKDQAISFYVKAMLIYENKGKKNTTQYAQMSNQAALLLLSFGQIQQACSLAKFAMRVLQLQGLDKLQEYMSSCSILSRIYQISHHFNEFSILGSECMQMLRKTETMNPSIFEEGLKICVYPLLNLRSSEQKKILAMITEFLQNFIKSFEGEQEIHVYTQAFHYLRFRNIKKNLFQIFHDMMQNIISIVDYLYSNNTFQEYDGYLGKNMEPNLSNKSIDFLQLFECIIIMVSPLYLYGIFREQ